MRPGRPSAQKLADELGVAVRIWRRGNRFYVLQISAPVMTGAELLEEVQPTKRKENSDAHDQRSVM